MTSAPSVKKMRWRSSVALPKLLKLKLAANCSAAEAMSYSRFGPTLYRVGLAPRQARVPRLGRGCGQYTLPGDARRAFFRGGGPALLPFARLALLVHVVGLLVRHREGAAGLFDGRTGG